MELLIQNQSFRLSIVRNRECLLLPKENQKLIQNDENEEKLVLMEYIGNLRLQMLGEFRNMGSSFLTEVKNFKNEFLQSCVEHSPREQVNENLTYEISERFINQLVEQISYLREQLRKKITNSLINQFSKNSKVIQTPQDKKKITEENSTP